MIDSFPIYGESRKIKEVLQIALQVAKSDAAVLITGESGTGKELFARFIQSNSFRSKEKFVTINCAAIPSNLLENEFFGHVKGAFTDAAANYSGKIAFANGGTIFLDEIGEMDLALQAKLLRFLQYKVYQPIGSNEEFKSDIRIIAATNKDLVKMIQRNQFREDLYYRLNVVPIQVPPLRDRIDDILLLAEVFLKNYNEKYNKKISGFGEGGRKKLLTYSWPGNVRELQNAVERAVVLARENRINEEDIQVFNESESSYQSEIKSLKDAVDDFKKKYIIYCLNINNWNQTKTAKVLQIQRTYLARLIKELEINKF